MSTIFISHSSADNEAAAQLMERLESWNHHSVFLDFDPDQGIQAGRSWERTLYRKLRACRAVIAWCTDTYLKSYWCFAEIALARMEGKPVFAVLDPNLGSNTSLPSILTEQQFIDLRKGEEQAWLRLKNGLKELEILGVSGGWDPSDPPYLGLNYYDEEHAPVFFGREDETRAGLELINRGAPNLIMVLGASGSGKSSLARAGILPRLRTDSSQFLVVPPFRPRKDPVREFAIQLSRAAIRNAPDYALRIGDEDSIVDQLTSWRAVLPDIDESSDSMEPGSTTPDERLHRLLAQLEELEANPPSPPERFKFLDWTLNDLRQATQSSPDRFRSRSANDTPLIVLAERLQRVSEHPNARIVILIDQFEELLGYEGEGPSHPANYFLSLLRATVDAESCPLLILGTMRSDFLGAFQRNLALRSVDYESLSLGPMQDEGMRRVIIEPAKLGALELETGLADRLLKDTETPDALPLLSFTLRVLWEKHHQRGGLEVRDYDDLGGLAGAISKEADALLRSTEKAGRTEDLRRAFLRMARLSEEGSYARQPVSWNATEIAPVHDILERFVDRRLLLKLAEGDDTVVEVAHEALFRSWTPLKTWLDNNRADLILKRQIHHDANAWDQNNRPADRLWHGGRLHQAFDLLGRESLPPLETAFVQTGLTRYRQQRLRKAGLVITAVAALAGFLIFSLWQGQLARKQRDQARRNEGLG